jgi:hypothetical protein
MNFENISKIADLASKSGLKDKILLAQFLVLCATEELDDVITNGRRYEQITPSIATKLKADLLHIFHKIEQKT